jgi:hypothetical protein
MDALDQGKPSLHNKLFAKSLRWSAALLIMAAPAAQARMASVGCVPNGNAATPGEANALCNQDLNESLASSLDFDPGAYISSPCTVVGGPLQGFFSGSVVEYNVAWGT